PSPAKNVRPTPAATGPAARRPSAPSSNRTAVLALIAAPVALAAVVLVLGTAIGLTWRSFHTQAAKQPNAPLVAVQSVASPAPLPSADADPQPVPGDDPRPVDPQLTPVAAAPELIAEPTPVAEPAPAAVAKVEPKPEEPVRPPP